MSDFNPADLVVPIVSGLFGLGGSSMDAATAKELQARQFEYQKQLNEQGYQYQQNLNSQQNLYARDNRALDDKYQRSMTQDSWLLNRNGMEAAGINPAFASGSTNVAASTPSTAAPTSGSVSTGSASAPSVPNNYSQTMGNIVEDYFKSAINRPAIREKEAEADKAESDAKLTKVHNEYEITRMTEGKDEASSKARKAAVDADVAETTRDNQVEQSNLQVENQKLQNDNQKIQNDILGIIQNMKDEELKQAKFVTEHQTELFLKNIEEIDSRISANKAASFASYQQGLLAKAQSYESSLRSELEKAKVPYAADLAYYMKEKVMNDMNISFNNKRMSDIDTSRSAFEFERDKQFHSGGSFTYYVGESMRNLLQGWLPFSGSVNYSSSKKVP